MGRGGRRCSREIGWSAESRAQEEEQAGRRAAKLLVGRPRRRDNRAEEALLSRRLRRCSSWMLLSQSPLSSSDNQSINQLDTGLADSALSGEVPRYSYLPSFLLSWWRAE